MRLVFILALIVCTSFVSATADSYLIEPDGSGDFPTIAAAISASADGDTILLANGRYSGSGNYGLGYEGKAITIRSASGIADSCTVDCAYLGRAFSFTQGEDTTSVLSCVSVVNGYVPNEYGGALYIAASSPLIEGCVFEGNVAAKGGAIRLNEGRAIIRDCRFFSNTALTVGGGIYAQVLHDSPLIEGSEFNQNEARGSGGGAFCDERENADIFFRSCTFVGNTADYGGGLYNDDDAAHLEFCTFAGNLAAVRGGAVYAAQSSCSYYSCSFYANSAQEGSAFYLLHSSPLIQQSVISHGAGGESFNSQNADPTLICCNVYGNAGGDWIDCIADQYGLGGNISEDPLFCNAAEGDLRLQPDSPCAPFSPPNAVCELIGAWPVGCSSCEVEVTGPNGGEVFCAGDLIELTWDSSDSCSPAVDLLLLLDGEPSLTIAEDADNDGSYWWMAVQSGGESDGYRLLVQDLDSGIEDASDASFTIAAGCSIAVLAPNGGESLVLGSEVELAWDHTLCCGAAVRLELLRDGSPCRTIAEETGNDGSFHWITERCGAETEGYALRVTDLGSGSSDDSDQVFSIVDGCSLVLLGPDGGETLSSGAETEILWDSDACGDSLRIELLHHDYPCLTIADGVPDTGSYIWTIAACSEELEDYRIRITDLESGAGDESDDPFIITPPYHILSIADVANDQGGQVRLRWHGCWHEASGDPQITAYGLYRRQDALLRSEPEDEQRPLRFAAYGGRRLAGWDFVATVPARGDSVYQYVAATLCDSTAAEGICWTTFFVSAMTDDPLVFFDTQPDSGYSVDNLAPEPPGEFHFESPTSLAWDESEAVDFDYFTVYGSFEPELDDAAVLLVHTCETSFDIAHASYPFYFLTATDFAGNEGEPAEVAVADGGEMPERPSALALLGNTPNPAYGSTEIAFALPELARATVRIYDAAGRRVTTLLDRELGAQVHRVVWRLQDDSGSPIPSGIYFCRLEVGTTALTRRMLIAH